MSDTRMLIVAGYPDVDVAEQEFRALAGAGRGQGAAAADGHDPRRQGRRRRAAGSWTPATTWAARCRAGAAASACWSGCSPRRCSRAVAVGAAAGAVVGQLRRPQAAPAPSRSRSAPPCKDGTAVDHRRVPRRRTGWPSSRRCPGAPLKSVVESDEGGIDELKSRARPRPWASSTPTARCCRCPTSRSAASPAARIDESVGDWTIVARTEGARGRPQRAHRAHRRRRLRWARTPSAAASARRT